MAIKSTLHRVNPSSQYKAADTNALLMLRSISGAFKNLLKTSDTSFSDTDPGDKLEMVLSNQDEDNIEIGEYLAQLLYISISDHVVVFQ